MKYRSLVYAFSLILFLTSKAIDFSRVNVAWQYDVNADLRMKHRVVLVDGITTLFVEIKVDSVSQWQFEYLVQDGYESEDHRIITPTTVDTLRSENGLLLKITLPSMDENLFVVKASKFESFYYYDIGLRIGTLPYPSVYPMDADGYPILNNYIYRSGSRWAGGDSFDVIQYTERFAEADPPMADMKPLAPNVDMDTSYVFEDVPDFKDNYFYVVRTDSNASTGVTILKVPPYFPKYRKLNELAQSMLYLTSEAEKKSIVNSKNLKQVFDSFWVNNFKTKQGARRAIRSYYSWVEDANVLFTDFKPGWKTDRGMMYIVFGLPDEIYRTGSLEEWYYDNGEAFEFTIISSFFAPRTYALRRNRDLEGTWYKQITAIRSGIK